MSRRLASSRSSAVVRAIILSLLVLGCVLAPSGCRSTPASPEGPSGVTTCLKRKAKPPTPPSGAPGTLTAPAGALPGTFAVTSTGEATYTMPLAGVPGRAGVEPRLAIAYDGAGDGVLGAGFSLAGLSAITRCPRNLAQDGEIHRVRYDAHDELCLDGRRLVRIGQAPGSIEYRTLPDTFVKVIGHYPSDMKGPADALSFEAFLPSGLIVEYGSTDSGRPLAPSGAPQAWLATKTHDGRGNAMSYSYCFDEEDGYTAEYAVDEIRYTRFDGSPALEASRAVTFIYAPKDPADVRPRYSGGMNLQRSLRLEAIQMLGPGDELVRSYDLAYALGPTTGRTLLTEVKECAGDGVCKPATRFSYTSHAAGFEKIATSILTPTSGQASPMVLDLDGDGLDDLLIPDVDPALSTSFNPITSWTVARNRGANASPPFLSSAAIALTEDWPMVAMPSDPGAIQPELGTAIDYDQDGRMDVFLHDVHGASPNWIVLLAQPDHTFEQHDTGIPRPFPLGVAPAPPALSSAGAAVHLADLDGDGVPDLIQCEDHGQDAPFDPAQAEWTVHLWKPAHGAASAGFDPAGETVPNLAGFECNVELYTVDIDADGKVDLVVAGEEIIEGTKRLPTATYSAFSRRHDGTWEGFDTKLPVLERGGHVVFLDVNGDGLPDAVESGFHDHRLRTYLNTGPTFAATPLDGLAHDAVEGAGAEDALFALAVPLDFNGDGRQDLLMPVGPGTLPGQSNTLPAWAILQAQEGGPGKPTFTLVDPHVPFEPALNGDSITLADPHGPRVGDVNGDGAPDILLPLSGVFDVFQNLAPDQDLLVAISDGMNAHDPKDPGFVPNVRIAYGHLTDASITNGTPAGSPALEPEAYLSHADPANGCAYPVACAVGSRRQVVGYATNDGADGSRHFSVRYRDGRYHRLGRGFLGFAERIVTDEDTGAGTATFYDNATAQSLGAKVVFPFAGVAQHERRWVPGLPTQPDPTQIELSFTDVTPTFVPTNGGATYFTLPTKHHVRLEEGTYPSNTAPTVEAFARQIDSSNAAKMLREATSTVSSFDTFGDVLVEDTAVAGVDLTLHVERTFENDTDRWVLHQLRTQTECSTAATLAQCRTLTRHTTPFGEIHDEATSTDDGLPDTQLTLVYERDAYGNVLQTTADDAFGHHRVSKTTYDAEGIYPTTYVNAANQTTHVTFEPRFGVLAARTDPNGLLTTRAYDGFGRLGLETRPDGTQTTITLARTRDGGPGHDAWRVTERTTTTGGDDDTVEVDSLGRAVRWWWHGPEPSPRARIMQEIAFDALGEHVARRSVPASEDTPQSQVLADRYAYDAMGREVRHTTPWNAVVTTAYDGLLVHVTDALQNTTTVVQDALGRAVTVTDATQAVTAYTYGPFGALRTVTAPGNPLTRTTRDAFGRVRQLDDPDNGTTTSVHDGFGELLSSKDALGRTVTYDYDALGRPLTRLDQHGAESLTTTWTWDTAAHGIGKLATLTSPDAVKTYAYTDRGQLHGFTLAIQGESDMLEATLGYDPEGRVATITYPTPPGATPFAVAQDYDAHGHVVRVRDSATSFPYWRLLDVDSAGRYQAERFGNGATTTRSYFPDKQSLQSILTQSGAATVQNLAYAYDVRRDLESRTDQLQPQNRTERFRYDAQKRLSCAYFGAAPDDTAPCALAYGYDPSGNGNLTFKSDLGTLVYGDPKHPHAVTGVGSGSFGYDAVGNQVARPDGTTITYTPFDLPKTITQPTGTVRFDYDGDERRVRKASPEAETLYFEELYERVTTAAPASVAHRFYVRSPERVVAVVTQGGPQAGTVYLHADPLGSVDALTDASGGVVEHRSYDPFGQRRNPVWGQPAPASFGSLTTVGFTGQEDDGELGLVNMKGRVYDPKLGRFLTPDPIVSEPLSGQSWNPYSYVVNNPLNLVDPSGFEEVIPPGRWTQTGPGVDICIGNNCPGMSPPPPPKAPPTKSPDMPPLEKAGTREEVRVGAAVRPVDVSPTGNTAKDVPQPVTTAPPDWRANPYVQVEAGFLGGLLLGIVPFGGVGQQLLDAGGVLPHGSPEARFGLAVGQVVGGIFGLVGGVSGEVLGGIASTTGIGAAIGVPAMVVSAAVVTGSLGNIAAGIRGLMTTGGAAWNKSGGVDFSRSRHLYRGSAGQKSIVRIKYTGSRRADYKVANEAAGLDKTPQGYTWHHLDDYDPVTNTGTMQLVEEGAHSANQPHVGGVKQYQDATGKRYSP